MAFGTAVSGRPAEVAGADSMVGLLINTVPVRATLTAATTTADLLEQLQTAHTHTLEHQHLALPEIHRITGHDQLFDTLFVYENYPVDTAALAGDDELAITEFSTREHNHYPLTVAAMPGHELGLRVEYDTEVFDAAGIEALIGRLQRVLAAMTTDPARRLSSIDVLDAGEHARLDEVGNRAVLTRPAPAGGVDSGGVRRPGGPHARGGGAESARARSWTYRELDEAANRLAHLLAGHGVGPGQRVAVLVPRSARGDHGDAGGAQDRGGLCADRPGAPRRPDRVRARRCRPDRRAHHRRAGRGWPARPGGHRYRRPRHRQPARHRAAAPGADDIAYLIYTSGTTGTPKGVAVAHHNVTQLLDTLQCARCRRPGCGRSAIPWPSTFSVWEIFGALLGGGRLVVVPDAVVRSPEELHALLVAEQVSVFSQTPSALCAANRRRAGPGWPARLQTVVFGWGSPDPTARRWLDRWAPGRVLLKCTASPRPRCMRRQCARWQPTSGVQPDRGAGGSSGLVRAGWLVAAGAGRGGRGVVCGRRRGGYGYWAGRG